MDAGKLRDMLLLRLTDEDVEKLFYLILSEKGATTLFSDIEYDEIEELQRLGGKDIRRTLSPKKLVSLCYFLLFRIRRDELSDKAIMFLIKHFDLLKKLLDCGGLAMRKIRGEVTLIGHLLDNPDVGRAKVTTHAWERFCSRFGEQTHLANLLMDSFKSSFARARLVELDPVVRVRRCIENGFNDAKYVFDGCRNVRFVVVSNEENPELQSIKTVEEPLGVKR